jgi:hypothetical protein
MVGPRDAPDDIVGMADGICADGKDADGADDGAARPPPLPEIIGDEPPFWSSIRIASSGVGKSAT